MNDNQKKFLNELDELFLKYDINEIFIHFPGVKEGARIIFNSHGKMLKFSTYCLGKFYDVETAEGIYKAGGSDE